MRFVAPGLDTDRMSDAVQTGRIPSVCFVALGLSVFEIEALHRTFCSVVLGPTYLLLHLVSSKQSGVSDYLSVQSRSKVMKGHKTLLEGAYPVKHEQVLPLYYTNLPPRTDLEKKMRCRNGYAHIHE